MIIGILSDTHDKLGNIDIALEYFKTTGVQHVMHCGDWKSPSALVHLAELASEYKLPVSGVLGNNDLSIQEFLLQSESHSHIEIREGVFEMQLGNKRVAVYHGHHVPTLRKVMQNDAYDIVFLGHTHKPRIENFDSKLVVNPGSTAFSIPRSKDWRPSVAIVNTEVMTAQLIYL